MDVTGTWYNELNSIMELRVDGARLHGKYQTAVGDAAGPYALHGWVDATEPFPTLGWVVLWKNGTKDVPAVTGWIGQAQTVDGAEQIDTTWLLTSSTKIQDDWESTLVGKDLFKRTMASEQEVRRALARRRLRR
jgi:hypothetical protein